MNICCRIYTEKPQNHLSPFSHFCINHIIFIQKFINIQEISHTEVKFQQLLRKFLSMKFLQELIHLPHHLKHSQRNCSGIWQDFVLCTLLFQSSKLSVHFFQCSHQTFAVIPGQSLRLQYIRSIHMSTVHFPSPVHQIVSFIDQKNVFSGSTLPEKSFQINIGIKYIIIITDHSVHPDCQIQAHFKGTHLPFLRIFQQSIPVIAVLRGPQFKNSIIHSVQMSSRPQTVLRIAFCFIAEAQLFLRGNGYHFKFQSMLL